jgi:hypothetical protein
MIKDLQHADKDAAKAHKAVDKAIHHVDKAVSKEHKTANALAKADHVHADALAAIAAAEREVAERKRQAAELAADLERKRLAVEEFQKTKSVHDVCFASHTIRHDLTRISQADREHKLAELHSAAAAAAMPHTGSPVPMSATSGHGPSAANGGPMATSTTSTTGPSAANGGAGMTQNRVGV